MSENRGEGPWFRLAKEEAEHSIEEHVEVARLAMKDVIARARRIRWLIALWVLTFVIFVSLVILELVAGYV